MPAKNSNGTRPRGTSSGEKKRLKPAPRAGSNRHRPGTPQTRNAAPAANSRRPGAAPKRKTATPRAKGLPKHRPVPERPAVPDVAAPTGAVALTDEEQIESAKYLPRADESRVFEEERFLFPETYGVNRIRLLVKDPHWTFAHWDVDPALFDKLRAEIGDRAVSLSRLTLRISDPGHGGTSVVLLPYGAKSWYVRTDAAGRSYRAQLGITLPSGEFRLLAESNTVATPRVGPSTEPARRVVSYKELRVGKSQATLEAARNESRPAVAAPGPWSAPPQDATIAGAPESAAGAAKRPSSGPGGEEAAGGRGGASETFRPERGGASDLFRR